MSKDVNVEAMLDNVVGEAGITAEVEVARLKVVEDIDVDVMLDKMEEDVEITAEVEDARLEVCLCFTSLDVVEVD